MLSTAGASLDWAFSIGTGQEIGAKAQPEKELELESRETTEREAADSVAISRGTSTGAAAVVQSRDKLGDEQTDISETPGTGKLRKFGKKSEEEQGNSEELLLGTAGALLDFESHTGKGRVFGVKLILEEDVELESIDTTECDADESVAICMSDRAADRATAHETPSTDNNWFGASRGNVGTRSELEESIDEDAESLVREAREDPDFGLTASSSCGESVGFGFLEFDRNTLGL